MNAQELAILIEDAETNPACGWPHAEALEVIAGLQDQLQSAAVDLGALKSQLAAAQQVRP